MHRINVKWPEEHHWYHRLMYQIILSKDAQDLREMYETEISE
jgi:hypothetical protein